MLFGMYGTVSEAISNMNAALGPNDLFGRLGGEEFAIVLTRAGRESGLAIAERIRISFEEAASAADGRPVGGTGECGHGGLRRSV
jgi:GGDEF domain-containing protein